MHPLVGNLEELSNEELHKKYNELMAKYNQAFRFGPTSVIPQMQMILENYRFKWIREIVKLLKKWNKKTISLKESLISNELR